jgi:hypothetical protein
MKNSRVLMRLLPASCFLLPASDYAKVKQSMLLCRRLGRDTNFVRLLVAPVLCSFPVQQIKSASFSRLGRRLLEIGDDRVGVGEANWFGILRDNSCAISIMYLPLK